MIQDWQEDLGMGKPRQRRSSTPAPQSPTSSEGDSFAPYRGPRVCHSQAGRWRPEHYHINESCIYCGHIEGWVPIRERKKNETSDTGEDPRGSGEDSSR